MKVLLSIYALSVFTLIVLLLPACSEMLRTTPSEELPKYKYEDVIEEECDDEWKTYHGHCLKYRNLA